ncbi:MAG: hypothetical protein SOX43_00490 [Pelistega sp.]|nr:hypothetical protein [Pelistega sp.]
MQKIYQQEIPEGSAIVWLFASKRLREQIARVARQAKGESAEIQVKSAYKTLLCEVRERGLLDSEKQVTIYYPVVDGDEPLRFRLECYPLDSLYPDCDIQYQAEPQMVGNGVYYRLVFADGREEKIFTPVKWRDKANGQRELCASAWVAYSNGHSEAIHSPYEDIYNEACNYLQNLPLTVCQQGLGSLVFDIELQGEDESLGIGHESLCLAEALHEDLYFSALEIFQYRLGLSSGDRTLKPGQILPVVRYGQQNSLSIREAQWVEVEDIPVCERVKDLEGIQAPLSFAQIQAEFNALNGLCFNANSQQGRPLFGASFNTHLERGLALSSGQHANESSGIVGGLREEQHLLKEGVLAFTYRPLGNPDGYAAFLKLCEISPRQMHHAARYTASGCDLAYGDVPERTFADEARKKLPQALVHLNLHGYPAHEWTRPLSGYVPRNFSRWTIPKGFFLIMRYQPAYKAMAEEVLQAAIAAVMGYPEQVAMNKEMLSRYLGTVGSADFPIANDVVPYSITEYPNQDYPIELITEAPDETVQGDWFRIAQESHYRVVMAVAKWLDEYDLTRS